MTATSHDDVVELLRYVTCVLVDETEQVDVTSNTQEDGSIALKLRVADSDIGKVIGKQGRTARALRNLVSAAATQRGLDVNVEFVDA